MKQHDAMVRWLLTLIDQAYDHPSWHGPNLRGAVRRVAAVQAAWRPQPRRRSIWEIVQHCAYWKYAVRRRLLGEKRGSFELKGSNWFAIPGDRSEKSWRAAVALLDREHAALRSAISNLSRHDLARKSPGSKLANGFVIAGIASHDLYHAGQIQLLKRLFAGFSVGRK